MIALILGGAPSVWRELAEAEALLNRRHLVVAANLAGVHHVGRLDGWATLHPDLLAAWRAERAGNDDFRTFTPDATAERWPGSSGLYAAQVSLFELGATAAVLCGVPMDSEAGHFSIPGSWAGTADYRRAFAAALPEIGGRVRSMGGWTAGLFGRPTAEWVGAIDNIKPMGATRPHHARTAAMHHVKNTGPTSEKFWARKPDGQLGLVRLGPGEGGEYEIDANQPRFAKGGAFSVKALDDAPKPKRVAKPKPSAKAKQPVPPAPTSDEG